MMNFNQFEINYLKGYAGVNGKKICIVINNENYMLKMPGKAKFNNDMSYSNSSISEHIGSSIFNMLKVEAQKTILGVYTTKDGIKRVAVACKDFETEGYILQEFHKVKNTFLESDSNGSGTDLIDVLEAIENQNMIDSDLLKKHFWDVFIVDSLIGNFDRHNGNWGLLVNQEKRDVKLAPVYDCGSCLFPQNTEQNMIEILKSKDEMNLRIFIRPESALKENNKKINYFDFISSLKNADCNEALLRIHKRINLEQINKFIDDVEYIDDTRKKFYKTILKERKEKIIDFSIKKLREID